MDPRNTLAGLEETARIARYAALIVVVALWAVGLLNAITGNYLAAIGLVMAGGTLSHTAGTLGYVLETLIEVADDATLDHDIIRSQQAVIIALREGRPS